MKFYHWQEVELPDQRYGAVAALLRLATLIDEHERKHECAVEIENMYISIVSEAEDNCVPLEVE